MPLDPELKKRLRGIGHALHPVVTVAGNGLSDGVRAELERARSQLEQTGALLTRTRDVLRKTTYTAPIDGVVTYIAVRIGENVVPGIQNAPGSYLMTISDDSCHFFR